MPEVEEAPETVEIPPSEKVHINRMADKFRDAMKAAQPAKAPEIPAIPKTHQDWKALKEVRDKYKEEAEALKPELAKVKAELEALRKASSPANSAQPDVDRFRAALDKTAPAADQSAEGVPVLPSEVKGKARESFDRLEGMMRQYRGDYEALKPQYEKVKVELEALKQNGGTPEHQAQMEALRKEVESRDTILKTFAISHDPRFVRYYGDRTQTAIAEAKEAVGENGSAVVEEILSQSGPQRDKALEDLADSLDLSDMRRTDLFSALRSIKAIEKEKAAELSKPEENFKAVQAYQQKLAAAEQERIAQNRAKLWQRFEAEIAPDMEGVDKALADSIRENVASVVAGKADSDRYISVLANAARWEKNKPILAEQAELISKLQGQLQEIQASNPTVQTNGGSSERRAPTGIPDNSDIGLKFKRALAGKR